MYKTDLKETDIWPTDNNNNNNKDEDDGDWKAIAND